MTSLRSEEFKRAAVKKFHSRGSRTVLELARELGVAPVSFYKWSARYVTSGVMKTSERRPQDLNAVEKLTAVIEFESLPVDKRGEYLRSKGLHSEHIESWKMSMQVALGSTGKLSAAERAERAEDKRKIKELERDLNKKNKALAEVTALLVLKKKADLIWGTGENE